MLFFRATFFFFCMATAQFFLPWVSSNTAINENASICIMMQNKQFVFVCVFSVCLRSFFSSFFSFLCKARCSHVFRLA